MAVQSQLFPEPRPPVPSDAAPIARMAPLWLQRASLCVLVLFCVYLGVLVAVLPWMRIWDDHLFFPTHLLISSFLHLGAVKGVISGLGLLDIWIGISEAVYYRDHRPGR